MKFWYTQPVFHLYNLWYWINPPGLLQQDQPVIKKYTNIVNIKQYDINTIDKSLLDSACHFIKNYYVQSPHTKYIPQQKNIVEYLKCSNQASYLTLYQTPKLLFEKNEPTTMIDDLISVITARPLNITLKGKSPFPTYYVDNLCVHPQQRKDGIAPQTIETHYYYLRQNNPKIKTCLFKREGVLNAIVPLTTYETFCFQTPASAPASAPALVTTTSLTSPYINVIEIGVAQLSLFLDFIHSQKNKFDCIIMPDVSNLINIIKTENIFIYGILDDGVLLALYIFRKPNLFYDKDEAIECILTAYNQHFNNKNKKIKKNIKQKNMINNIFINGFNISLNKIKEKLKTTILLLENTGHTNIIIDALHASSLLFKSPTAFFFYNYACYSVPSNKCLILY